MTTVKKASPKDLIWAGSVQWESGNGSPTYAYVFGLDEAAVDTALQHLQSAVTKKEFHENYSSWVPLLGQSKKTGEEEIFEGIDESIKIRGPSRHQLDEMWFEGAHMPEVLQRIATEPLVIDLPTMAFDDLASYCQNPGALKPFVIGGNADIEPAYNMASTKESEMTQRKQPTPRRRTMRRKATAKQIRQEVRERLERRAQKADKPVRRERPAAAQRPERRVSAERVDEMAQDRRRKSRLAELQDRRESREHEARMAELTERRDARAREARLAELREARAERSPRSMPKRRAPAAAPKKAEVVAPSTKKQIYVKADNSAGMPEGYYELDEKATRMYQAHVKRTAAAKKAPSRKKTAAPKKGKKAPASKKRRKAAPRK